MKFFILCWANNYLLLLLSLPSPLWFSMLIDLTNYRILCCLNVFFPLIFPRDKNVFFNITKKNGIKWNMAEYAGTQIMPWFQHVETPNTIYWIFYLKRGCYPILKYIKCLWQKYNNVQKWMPFQMYLGKIKYSLATFFLWKWFKCIFFSSPFISYLLFPPHW